MNKLTVINELRKCVEPRFNGNVGRIWDVWYKGVYLGEITKTKTKYFIYREDKDFTVHLQFGERKTFMAAISSFAGMAIRIDERNHSAQMRRIAREAMGNSVDLKQIGLRPKKTLLQKIKGWFK